ncbi:MAG: hypothetical protein OEU09_14085 [Rhodospirillales bacterium]|nr:hypothetical protein [Rhodospirillales bacterium]MDH3912418.1 hypothetical protein [Rhodospirillales bacterium]
MSVRKGIDALLERLEARVVSGTVERADGTGPQTAILPDEDCRAAGAVIRALRTALDLRAEFVRWAALLPCECDEMPEEASLCVPCNARAHLETLPAPPGSAPAVPETPGVPGEWPIG